VVSVPQHHGNPASVSQPPSVGRICRLDLFYRVAALLVSWTDPGSCNLARPGARAGAALHLRYAGDGLARFGDSLASVRNGVFAVGWFGAAPGGFGWHCGQL